MSFKCVNCGEAASALYKNYGPSVLKLTKCENCKGIVDKYIEYDPVIVMIDLVLISNEALRHIIYNTDFKSYWKLFIILLMLETYGVWHNDSLFNIAVNTICDIKNNITINSTYLSLPVPVPLSEPWASDCRGWEVDARDDADLFIWEKDFYIQFLSTFSGIVAFVSSVHVAMAVRGCFTKRTVGPLLLVKSFSLSYASALLTLPMLVWGAANTPPHTRLTHYTFVFLYSFVVYYHVLTVLYEAPKLVTVPLLIVSHLGKYLTMFHMTPLIRRLVG